jgi:hypothetical protein
LITVVNRILGGCRIVSLTDRFRLKIADWEKKKLVHAETQREKTETQRKQKSISGVWFGAKPFIPQISQNWKKAVLRSHNISAPLLSSLRLCVNPFLLIALPHPASPSRERG